jgi:hypothetical protein
MLHTFDFAVKGPANKSAQGMALGGVGIAVGLTRRPRGARRGSPDPADLPDRQVSRAHRRPRFQRCSCLLSLLQTKETYRSSIWAGSGDPRPARVRAQGGVRRPAPSAGSYSGTGQETRAQRGRVPGWRKTNNCATSRRISEGFRDSIAALARRFGVSTTGSRIKVCHNR